MADPRPLAVWTVRGDEDGVTLERFLRARVPSESIERVREAIATRVRLSWTSEVGCEATIRAGGEVRLLPEPLIEVPDDRPIRIVGEGDGWFAVDKPAGIPVHPSRSVRINSLIERLRRAHPEPGLRLAHRLDRETSGVLLLARNKATAARLGRAFERGAVDKDYVAVVRGAPAADAGVIDLAIGRATGSDVKVRQATGHGRPARTRWFVERRGAGRSVLRLVPETGRRHQLRVHLEAIGHPIVGDVLYGRPDRDYLDLVTGIRNARRESGEPARMLLHCRWLRVHWPGLEIDVRVDAPDDFLVHLDRGGMDPEGRSEPRDGRVVLGVELSE